MFNKPQLLLNLSNDFIILRKWRSTIKMFHIRIYRSLLNFISSFTTLKSFINLSRLTLLPIQVVFFFSRFLLYFHTSHRLGGLYG